MKLEFDEPSHTYKIGGFSVPGVTSVIGSVLPGWKASEWHLQRGKATHLACHFLDAGKLVWESVDPEILPRVQAWQKFRADFPATVVASETPLGHRLLQYAGTLDRIFDYGGELVLCDIKNSVSPMVRLQLAFYSMAWKANRRTTISRAVAVELRDDATYRCLWIEKKQLRQHEQEAMALLTVYNFAKTYGLNFGVKDERPSDD